ncbi:thioesterase II family protein [Streptomyces omiyaensis]|uniref:Thioesterase II family protein n=1 Tax=Streptomyces omiyaensis TaxID=68247 RepID=A0ABW7BVN7_9ACTN
MGRLRERGWIRTLAPVEDPAVRLVCFPHSGGSATAFHGWTGALPPGVALAGVQYPGRGDRFGEQLVDDVAEMAGRVVAELLRLPPAEHVLFGHSLGALVAYETAMLLRDMGAEPRRLCASACLPPGAMKNRDVHLAPDDEFWAALGALGGIDPGIIENAEMRELFTPTLRSDLRAHAQYRPRGGTTSLSCPVSCYHGDGDPLVDEERMAGWAGVTSGPYTLRVRPGGHFHVSGDVAGLVADVLGREPV